MNIIMLVARIHSDTDICLQQRRLVRETKKIVWNETNE